MMGVELTLHVNEKQKNNDASPLFIVNSKTKNVRCMVIAISVSAFLMFASFFRVRNTYSPVDLEIKPYAAVTSYQCPSKKPGRAKNDKGNNMEWYLRDSRNKLNFTNLHDAKFDGWGLSFDAVKDALRPWKVEAFVPYLKSGDSIYESACGSGLNLLLTLEVLLENNITSITVSGNDYLEKSIYRANQIWESPSIVHHKGSLCVGDSTNLSFVPSSTFDLVYTGYLDPLLDPLNLLPFNATSEEQGCSSVERCNSELAHEKNISLQEQKAQEEWTVSWVFEMIRIAKPGAPVIVETIQESICRFQKGWGGVDQVWWKTAILSYGLDVDPESVILKPSGVFKERYNILMKKNK